MRQQRTGHRRVLAAIALAGFAAGVAHAEERVGQTTEAVETVEISTAATEVAISERAYEWVDISIHMPDGRVIHTKERRYPSRSRVFQLTGKLPMVKRGAGGPSGGSGIAGSGDELMSVMVEGDAETGAESGSIAGPLDGASVVESLVDAFVEAGGESIAEPVVMSAPSTESVVVDQDSGRAVRVFKKSS